MKYSEMNLSPRRTYGSLWKSEICSIAKDKPMVHRERSYLLNRERQTYVSSRNSEIFSIAKAEPMVHGKRDKFVQLWNKNLWFITKDWNKSVKYLLNKYDWLYCT